MDHSVVSSRDPVPTEQKWRLGYGQFQMLRCGLGYFGSIGVILQYTVTQIRSMGWQDERTHIQGVLAGLMLSNVLLTNGLTAASHNFSALLDKT